MDNSFLPQEYTAPVSGGHYAKINDGENKFRILSKPLLGWVGWQNKKPLRFHYKSKPDISFDEGKTARHFWAVIVWDYSDKSIKVLEITQSTIQQAIVDLSRSEHFGAPWEYDVIITKSGRDKNTKYNVLPLQKTKVSDEIHKASLETPIYLDNIFTGADPFDVKDKSTEIQINQLPF